MRHVAMLRFNETSPRSHVSDDYQTNPQGSANPTDLDLTGINYSSPCLDAKSEGVWDDTSQVSMASDPLREAVADTEALFEGGEAGFHSEDDGTIRKISLSEEPRLNDSKTRNTFLETTGVWTLETPERCLGRNGHGGHLSKNQGGTTGSANLSLRQVSPGDEQPPSSPNPQSRIQWSVSPRASFLDVDISRINLDDLHSSLDNDESSTNCFDNDSFSHGAPSRTDIPQDSGDINTVDDNDLGVNRNECKEREEEKAESGDTVSGSDDGKNESAPSQKNGRNDVRVSALADTLHPHRYNSSPVFMQAVSATHPRFPIRYPQLLQQSSSSSVTKKNPSCEKTTGVWREVDENGSSPFKRRPAITASRYAAMKQKQKKEPQKPLKSQVEHTVSQIAERASLAQTPKAESKNLYTSRVAARYAVMKRKQRFIHSEQHTASSPENSGLSTTSETQLNRLPPCAEYDASEALQDDASSRSKDEKLTETGLAASSPQPKIERGVDTSGPEDQITSVERSSSPWVLRASPSSRIDRRRFRSVVPYRVFLDSPDDFTHEFDSFSTPIKDEGQG